MSSLEVRILPIFSDNYVFVIVRTDSKTCVVVDPGDAEPVQDYLLQQKLTLESIILTHHHSDHVGGANKLKEIWDVPVFAPLKNKLQIPFATDYVAEGRFLKLLNDDLNFRVFELSGHTQGHIGFYDVSRNWLFSGDVLFGLGCGRLFEGTFAQGYDSLQRIKMLPDETIVYCTHEYTEANLHFCKNVTPNSIELDSYEKILVQKRAANLPSVPLNLGIEKMVNPFLSADNLERFTFLRDLKNRS